jgi:carbamoyl-phosphate synthase large subunit
MKNILITSAGRRVSLVRFFKKELNIVFPNAKVFTTDANPEYSAACRVSDGFFKVQRVTDPNYIEELLALVLANNIKLIIPTIDTELLILSQNINLFKQHNVDLVISDFEVVKIFRDKRLTHDFFEKYNINTAKEFDKQNYQLPIYIKPIDGSRSIDNFVIKQESDLTDYHFSNPKLMFLEYLDHEKHTEFTIDLYYDKNSDLKCFIPRERIEVREGEVNKAITKKPFFVDEIHQKMAHITGFRGCITFQVFVNCETNSIFGIEINPRFGGGYPLSYLAGGNFPKWIIQEYMLDVNPIPVCNNWEQNLMMLRYDDEVLVHNYNH